MRQEWEVIWLTPVHSRMFFCYPVVNLGTFTQIVKDSEPSFISLFSSVFILFHCCLWQVWPIKPSEITVYRLEILVVSKKDSTSLTGFIWQSSNCCVFETGLYLVRSVLHGMISTISYCFLTETNLKKQGKICASFGKNLIYSLTNVSFPVINEANTKEFTTG